MKHDLVEVIAPRIFGGDTVIKHAVRCDRCGLKMILEAREVDRLINEECNGDANCPECGAIWEYVVNEEKQLPGPTIVRFKCGNRTVDGVADGKCKETRKP